MNKLAKIIETLEYDDLMKIKKDLDEGNIKKLINQRLEEEKTKDDRRCPVCNRKVKEKEGVTLYFGNPDFRKRATFDGMDCLEYFLERLKHTSKQEENDIVVERTSDHSDRQDI